MSKNMSKILMLNEHDLYLTYSWSSINHGICGHTYEVIDYYLLLKNHFKTGILLCEDITWDIFQLAITDKYDLTEEEVQDIKQNTIFSNRPQILKGSNILFTDGSAKRINEYTLFFDNIFMFACGDRNPFIAEKATVLQDYRLYPEAKNTIDYKKKINFNKYKKEVKDSDSILLYGSKNCRAITDEAFTEIRKITDRKILCLVNEIPDPVHDIEFALMPYKNLFDNFGTYIYTPIERKWDCSPRFLAECKFYNKQVMLYDIDYFEEDLGLKYRWYDINENFDSLFLNEDDKIIEIIKERI